MCGGGNGAVLGALAGALLAPATFGASLLPGALAGGVAGGALGAVAGDTLVDKPADQQKKALEEQQKANGIAIDQAKASATAADQAFNRANGKSPDVAGLIDANKMNAKGGQSGTMLTGTQGVDPSALLLGKKTLLGA